MYAYDGSKSHEMKASHARWKLSLTGCVVWDKQPSWLWWKPQCHMLYRVVIQSRSA